MNGDSQDNTSGSENDPHHNVSGEKHPPSFGASDPTDGRGDYEWESKYPPKALRVIRNEAIALIVFFLTSLFGIFFAWCGLLEDSLSYCCNIGEPRKLQIYSYFMFAGLLGGTIYSIKFLYHAVARGIWHLDRQLWRFLSPLMSLGVAFIVAALISAGFVIHSDLSGASAISIGFVAGYFSDAAIAKMYEVANVFFGTSSSAS